MFGIKLDIDWSEMDEEIDRLGKMPDAKMSASLEAGLEELFGMSQTVVHIETASLKGSGKRSSESDRVRHKWHGEITYGGESPGVNNPVEYAWYEQRRDDVHDFMKPVHMLAEQVLAEAILRGL